MMGKGGGTVPGRAVREALSARVAFEHRPQ